MAGPRTWIYVLIGTLTLCGCGGLKTAQYRSPAYRGGQPLKIGNVEYGASAYQHQGPFQLVSPVPDFKMNRGFKNGGRKNHKGIDLGGRRGTDIYAAHPGVVVYAGRKFRGYGKMVLIEYDGSWATLYAHLNSISVRNGDVVKPGQVIGEMGATGRATGVHLHFELIKNKQPIDPLPFLRMERLITSEGH